MSSTLDRRDPAQASVASLAARARAARAPGFRPSEFLWTHDPEACAQCKRCLQQCGFKALSWEEGPVADPGKCVGCHRCEACCPQRAIAIQPNPQYLRPHPLWTDAHRRNLWLQAETGGVLLTGMGNDLSYPVLWDHLLLDACQVTNPSIDPLREPMELRTFLGAKPDRLALTPDEPATAVPSPQASAASVNRGYTVQTDLPPNLELETPIVFAAMSYGSIGLSAQKAIAMAATELGTMWNTGEGGLHADLMPYAHRAFVQCASGRFGVSADYLEAGGAIEIKIGQGAKPGIGGHLPGEKVSAAVSETRMIPVGSDALSPAPQHDIYSIEDLRQLIYALKEATNYEKPVSVKIAAVHNVAAIASGIVRAGADIVYLDGFRGGTGAAPTVIRDHLGIPIEIAIAVVDEQLREERIRNQASLIAAGGIRSSADIAKAIALGADAVALGTAALLALGCTLCQKCYTGCCSWGITTQDPALTRRLDPYLGSQRLINLIRAWSAELEEILGAMGVNAIESLRGSRERLRGVGLDKTTLDILGVKPAGVGA